MLRTTRCQLTLGIIALSVLGVLPVSAQSINEDLKITASDAAAEDFFGSSVAISGTTAIVGADRDDDAGSESGSAYIFDTTTGQEFFKLTASDAEAGDLFGFSVAISGTTAIVGAVFDRNAGSFSGSAYIFDTTTGQQLFKLTASDAAPFDRFGFSVAISGTTAIVGIRDFGGAPVTGSAY
ncbi:MAG: FG-GAP repeat protein, partial [Phycisphaerales bacterium]|nr:FG-GAP repeat protein [Phycisphaerales bacterium]